jgi:hypothetical protein
MKKSTNIFEKVAVTLEQDRKRAFIDNPCSDKYFELSHLTDTKEIGRHYPQTDYINLEIAHSLVFDELLKEPVKFEQIKIHKTSKLTDCISTAAIAAHAFLLSKRTLDIFRQFDLGNYKTYPATVFHNDVAHEYGVIHFVNDLHSKLDFAKSKFYVADMLGSYQFDVDVTDEKDYESIRQLIKQGEYPNTEKWSYLSLKFGVFQNGIIPPDIFTIFSSSTNPYITTRFAQTIFDNELTGFKIERAYNIAD